MEMTGVASMVILEGILNIIKVSQPEKATIKSCALANTNCDFLIGYQLSKLLHMYFPFV